MLAGDIRDAAATGVQTVLVTLAGPAALCLLLLLALFPSAALAAPDPYAHSDKDAGGVRNVLPPGQGQNVNAAEAAAFLSGGARPPHDQDQLSMYGDLVYAVPGLRPGQLGDYFKDASFGTRPGERERTYSPRADVTIVRDSFGVPHIYGQDRLGAAFGAGYVAAEDRLFFIDVLRHAGRAQLSSFVGGAQAGMDRSVWADTPYDESELQLQFDLGDEVYGKAGERLQQSALAYVDGVNAYIAEIRANPSQIPVEYGAIGLPAGPEDWKVTDIIATASLVAGIFGKGGGNEVGSALVLEAARERFGRRGGKRVWRDFRSANDPEAPTTVQHQRFPYQRVPRRTPGRALPDAGSAQREPLVVESNGTGGQNAASARDETASGDSLLAPLNSLSSSSNALLIPARESQSGTPLAVMGPQVAYFTPQILMEQSLHAPKSDAGPAIDARGAAFPGSNQVVQLGHGRNYAWSATSAGQDIVDTFAVRLCEPDGSRPSLSSTSYRWRGRCRPFEVLERTNEWSPNAADSTPAGSETLRALRSQVGIVTHRALIHGKPYAYTRLRVTYWHEVDSGLGFVDFNNPKKMRTPSQFFRAACKIDYTFNWFYINRRHIAYFNSGKNPIRSRFTHPDFPAFAKPRYFWRDYESPLYDAKAEPCHRRPRVVDQRYITSWNNKQAPAYRSSDDRFNFTSLDRVKPLDDRIRAGLRGKRKLTLTELVEAMEDAGTVDLRGAYILPWVLRVLRTEPVRDEETRGAIQTLAKWHRTGAHRRDRNRDGTYEQAKAVQLIDAWWPRLVEAQFKPVLGQKLYDQIVAMQGLVDHPGDNNPNQGSAFDDGWWYVEKDLRDLLGAPVEGRYSRVYCGRGDLGRCRAVLLRSLKRALEVPYNELYPRECAQGDRQWCYDAVEHLALGAITQPPIHWINRPTFQQIVEIGK